MNRREYIHALIRLFLEQAGAPPRAAKADWATAQRLYNDNVPLDDILHAIRLATLRRSLRAGDPLPPVRTLAYYRLVLEQLTAEERDADYAAFVHFRYRELVSDERASHSQNRAVSHSR